MAMNGALPVIDLSGLEGAGRAAFEATARKIALACRDTGFFYCINHGVPAALIEQAFALSHQFFALPAAAKTRLAIEAIGGNRGYSGLRHEALDPLHGADFKEAYNVGLELAADDPEILAGMPFRNLNAWPPVPEFREAILAYFEACANLARQLHRAFAFDLGLAEDFFEDKLDRPMATLRLLRYPAAATGETGAGEHTDYGNITLLATDGVGGLEVRARNGGWIAAPVIQGAFIVNIGDCLMRWSNDVYVSTPHRVITRGGNERYSIAFFCDPNPEAMVEAIAACVPPGEKPLYPPVKAADYLAARLAASVPRQATP